MDCGKANALKDIGLDRAKIRKRAARMCKEIPLFEVNRK
jgi:hypothetical protein